MTRLAAKTDRQLQQDVTDELRFDPRLDTAHLGVAAADGVVTLSGQADSEEARHAASETAMRVGGVRGLVNEIAVQLPVHHQQDDTALTRAAVTALSNNLLVPDRRVRVQVQQGVVTLSGTVTWHFERLAALHAVRMLRGVRGVQDRIEVGPHPEVNWVAVKKEIQRAFGRHASVDALGVGVTVDAGTVTLSGTVRSLAERRDAEEVAWSVPGVRRVENELLVEPQEG